MANADTARLILIRAAAGFGKTTLMQQLREQYLTNGKGALWVNLEPADNDLQRFVNLLDNGLRDLLPAASGNDQRNPQDLLQDIAVSTRPFALLLDEVEVIQNPDVLDFLQQLIEQLPSGSVVVMASRSTPGYWPGADSGPRPTVGNPPGRPAFHPRRSHGLYPRQTADPAAGR